MLYWKQNLRRFGIRSADSSMTSNGSRSGAKYSSIWSASSTNIGAPGWYCRNDAASVRAYGKWFFETTVQRASSMPVSFAAVGASRGVDAGGAQVQRGDDERLGG